MLVSRILIIFFLIIVLSSCQKDTEQTEQPKQSKEVTNSHKVEVKEVIQAASYTYLNVSDGNENYWIAITRREVEEGATLYYQEALEMKDFESRDLERTFDRILFVQNVSDSPMKAPQGMLTSPHGRKPTIAKQDVAVKAADDGITIADLFSNKDTYSGKTVKIRGKVTKYNAGIMGRNWIHIQDGTNSNGEYDLTVTSNDVVKVGDVVTFEGVITLDKDFGAGYSYDVIMEESKVSF